MKKTALFLATLTVLSAACNKKGDDVIMNQWTADGQNFRAVNVGRTFVGFGIMADDGNPGTDGNSITFLFNRTIATGTYKVVDYASAADEVSIVCYKGGVTNAYRSDRRDDRTIYVNVTNSKASIYFSRGVTLQPVLPVGPTPGPVEVKGAIRE